MPNIIFTIYEKFGKNVYVLFFDDDLKPIKLIKNLDNCIRIQINIIFETGVSFTNFI